MTDEQKFGNDLVAMLEELASAPEFQPSTFWRMLNDKNTVMLKTDGLQHFKRTVSQNYFGWMIIEPYHRFFRTAVKDWLFNPALAPLVAHIENKVTVRLYVRDQPLTLNSLQRFIYKFFVGMLWEQMRRVDFMSLEKLIEEPLVGDPIRIHLNKKLISLDTAASITDANTLLPLVQHIERPCIAEIGAGHGRLAYAIASVRSSLYCVFDIPPALQVSQWYIEQTLPKKKIFRFRRFKHFEDIAEELDQSDVAFFTSNQLQLIPSRYFDIVSSISTLPELTAPQVALFLLLMQKTSRGHIFLKQWKRWKNDSDGTDFTLDDYQFTADWRQTMICTDPLISAFFNATWSRQG